MGGRLVALTISLTLIAGAIFTWIDRGDSKFGVDFSGGTELVIGFEKEVSAGEIRSALEGAGIKGASVQKFDPVAGGEKSLEYSVRLKAEGESDGAALIKSALGNIENNKFQVLKQDFVGPIIGEQIREDGMTALVAALVCILLYVSFRFEWRFAVGAIAALMHDVFITTGIYIFTDREISVAVLAALLTIIGYSLNDTIIVFDRVRENINQALKKGGKKAKDRVATTLTDIVNASVNQTLSRTLLTSFTTLFVVGALWLLGGGAVVDLAFTLVIGVVVGTYSSIFVACTALLFLKSK